MPTTVTTSNETQSVKSADGLAIGQSSSDLVGFWGATPVDQAAAMTAQLTTITMADTAGTPDYSLAAVTTTSAGGCSNAQEFITLLFVIRNLQVRMLEVEACLEGAGFVAAN